jgi:hypothetical protein
MISIGLLVTLVVGVQTTLPKQSSVNDVVARLHATEWSDRERAVAVLEGSTAGSALLGSREVQDALLELLTSENRTIDELFLDGRGASGVHGEGYSEYYARILGLAQRVVSTLPANEKGNWLREMVAGSYNPGSALAVWMASHGDLVVDALIQLSTAGATTVERSNGFAMLTNVVTATAASPLRATPQHHPLSATNRVRALTVLRQGLDRGDGVSREIVWALRRDPSAESLSILQEFAKRARGRQGYATYRFSGIHRTLSEEVDQAIAAVNQALAARPR